VDTHPIIIFTNFGKIIYEKGNLISLFCSSQIHSIEIGLIESEVCDLGLNSDILCDYRLLEISIKPGLIACFLFHSFLKAIVVHTHLPSFSRYNIFHFTIQSRFKQAAFV